MLWIIASLILVFWALGVGVINSPLIHTLLIVALVVFIVQLIRGQGVE